MEVDVIDEGERAIPGPTEVELGRTLAGLRVATGLDVGGLAERSGLEREVIEALELGEHEADLATLHAIAKGLGVRLGVIITMAERGSGPPLPT